MDSGSGIRKKFLKEVDSRNRSFRPLRAALYILQAEDSRKYPDSADLTLRAWSQTLSPLLTRESEPYQKIRAFNNFFFQELDFQSVSGADAGSETIDLHSVLARRRGMAVSLALVYYDLAYRLSIPLQTLSFPGHLLFASAYLGRGNFLDPADGEVLGLDEARHRVELRYSSQMVLIKPQQLTVLSDRQLLERYLVTLKGIYLAGRRYEEALRVANWRLSLVPKSVMARWERGLLLYELNRFDEAHRDLGNQLARGVAARQDPRNLRRARVCALLASLQKSLDGK